MYERLWYELVGKLFQKFYLLVQIKKIETQNKWIENGLLLTSFASIGGIFKYVECSILFGWILLFINGFRLIKSKFMVSDSELSALKSSLEFYIDHTRKLEKLWREVKKEKIDDDEAESQLDALKDDERVMMKINKHEMLERKEPMNSKALELSKQQLNIIKNG
jgi:hypothetical protein